MTKKSSKTAVKNTVKTLDGPLTNPVPVRDGPIKNVQDLSSLFFHSPTSRSDGVFEPLLCKVVEHLKLKGVPDENLKQALMLILGAASAHLGYPLAMLLPADDALSAARLIESAIETVPQGWTVRFDTLSPAQLFVNGGLAYRDKCIVCQNPEGLTKVSGDLDLMLTRGYAVRQEILNKKYSTSLEEFRAEGFPSFIGIESQRKREAWNHPSIVKIPVAEGLWRYANPKGIDGNSIELFRIRKCIQRLRQRPVEVPFSDAIERALAESGVSHADILKEVVMKVIALIAIINQPPPVTMHEIGSYIYGIDESHVMKWLVDNGAYSGESDAPSFGDQSPITATKIDYCIAKTLLERFVSTKKASLTERQMKVFGTIKDLNWQGFRTSMTPNASDIEKLATLAKSSSYCPDREKIFKVMNSSGKEDISLTTVNNDLIELCNMGVIGRVKAEKQRYYKYYVMTLDIEKQINLPAVSDIIDPIYQGREVDMVNPITGQIDKI